MGALKSMTSVKAVAALCMLLAISGALAGTAECPGTQGAACAAAESEVGSNLLVRKAFSEKLMADNLLLPRPSVLSLLFPLPLSLFGGIGRIGPRCNKSRRSHSSGTSEA